MRREASQLVLVCTVVALASCQRPRYIGCQSSFECDKHSCCVVGMGRYSIPTCQPRREEGESCRPGTEAVNITLQYPDGAVVPLSHVYYIHCPCLGGLACESSCVPSPRTNHLQDYTDEY